VKPARDITKLRRFIFLSQIASIFVFLFGAASVTLFFDPSLVRVPDDQANSYRGNWIWLLTGLLFIIFAGICIFVAGRWSRRLLWIYRNVTPEIMRIEVEIDSDSDRTAYYAVLTSTQDEIKEPIWKVALYSPSWNVRSLKHPQMKAKVFFDPKSLKPAVIETEYGLLWIMAGNGATEVRISTAAE
jgi:hypothetical protein